MPSKNSGNVQMYHTSDDLLPYRCPSCEDGKRFRSLIALRLHTSIMHETHVPLYTQKRQTDWTDGIGLNKPFVEDSVSLDVGVGKSLSNNGSCSLDLDDTLSNTSIDDMFNKYSMKCDQVLKKYDSKSRKLENKLKLAKQVEEMRKQKQQLQRIKAAWKAVHGVSQLVDDTDAVIKRSAENGAMVLDRESRSFTKQNQRNHKKVTESAKLPGVNVSTEQQLDLSIQLAAQYKALALGAEEKLKDKTEEEEQLKQYITATAKKEQEAKIKLATFMEELLKRAEDAESKLEVYESQTAGIKASESYRSSNKRRLSPKDRQTSSIRNRKQRSNVNLISSVMAADPTLSLDIMTSSRLSDSGIALSPGETSSTTKGKKRENRSSLDDSNLRKSTERPRISEPPHFSGYIKQSGRLGAKQLSDTAKLVPFSNVLTSGRNSNVAADRRVALFCVFMHLRSVDLIRCAMVCKEWRDVSRHPQLWSRIRLHDVNVNPNLFKLISRWSHETCSLCLKNIGLLSNAYAPTTGQLEEGLEMVLKSSFDKLLVISIDQCDPVLTSRALWLVSCHNRRIQSVSYRSSIDPVSHQVAWSLGSSCRDIVSLEVAPLQPCSVRGLFDNNVARLLSWCWPQLQALSFGGLDIDGAGLLAVALNCHHLKVLELDHARGITESQAFNACKHGLKELRTLLFTHTPVQAATLLCFLESLTLDSLHLVVTKKDYYTRNKYHKIGNEYFKISKALKNLQKHPKYKQVVSIECD